MLEPAFNIKARDAIKSKIEWKQKEVCIPMGQIIAFLIPSTPDFIA